MVSTVFGRLSEIKEALQATERDIVRLCDTMPVTVSANDEETSPTEDLLFQLGESVAELRHAIDLLEPLEHHVDQSLSAGTHPSELG
jgi:hypothetical protein